MYLSQGKYFQKGKVREFSTEKLFPKKEILIDYIIRSWENISKKGNSPDSSQK